MTQQYLIERSFDYDANDLAVAFHVVAHERYGTNALRGIRTRWWSRTQLELISVKVNIGKFTTGVKGPVEIPAIPAKFVVGAGTVHVFDVEPKERAEVDQFLDAVANQLELHSIYRGKAIDSGGDFLDLSAFSLDDMVYNNKVLRDLRAHVWTMITHGDLCERVKIGRARKVLFSGPYGSGKTMAAFLTAQLALKHGYTFFYVKPTDKAGQGVVRNMIAFARRYQPSIVLVEDCDREQREANPFEHGAIMAEVDGLKSKGNNMMLLMTTNFSDKISKGLLRPGRIDKEIDFSVFTEEDIKQLLQKVIPVEWLKPDIDWARVGKAAASFSGAFVQEIGKTAMLLGISDDPSGTPSIGTDVLVEAASGLRSQHERSNARIGFTN